MNDELARLFETVDDPVTWEHPSGFDRASKIKHARAFLVELERRLGSSFVIETGLEIQDASFHSQIDLGGCWLRFSNFGEMIALTPDHDLADGVILMARRIASCSSC